MQVRMGGRVHSGSGWGALWMVAGCFCLLVSCDVTLMRLAVCLHHFLTCPHRNQNPAYLSTCRCDGMGQPTAAASSPAAAKVPV